MDKLNYYAIKMYFMLAKTIGKPEPIFLGINSTSNIELKHAIIVIGTTKDGLQVADPNTPGDKNRFIPYTDDGFKEYVSGKDVASNTHRYDTFTYIPYSQLNNEFIASSWPDVRNKTIGERCFKKNIFMYGYENETKADILKEGIVIKNKNIEIISSCSDCKLRIYTISGDTLKRINGSTFSLSPGKQTIGIFVIKKGEEINCNGEKNENIIESWADFQWFNINVEQNTSSYFFCKVNGVEYSFPTASMFRPIANPPIDAIAITGYNGKNSVSITFNPSSLLKGRGNYMFHYLMPFAPQQNTSIYFTLTQPDKPALASSSTKYAVWNDMLANGPTSGSLAITEFSDYIEGTFAFENNGDPKFVTPNVKVTEGRFRCKIVK